MGPVFYLPSAINAKRHGASFQMLSAVGAGRSKKKNVEMDGRREPSADATAPKSSTSSQQAARELTLSNPNLLKPCTR